MTSFTQAVLIKTFLTVVDLLALADCPCRDALDKIMIVTLNLHAMKPEGKVQSFQEHALATQASK